MNQCINKLLGSLDHLYEALFQKIIELFARRGIIRPLIRRPAVPVIELQPIDHSLRQPLVLHSCTSTPVFTQSQTIYRRAESEKDFRKCMIPNLGDTIYKVDSYSRDVSLLNLFEDKQEQCQTLNLQDNHQKGHKLQTIIEENKIQQNSHEGCQSQNQSQQFIKHQQQQQDWALQNEKQQLPIANLQDQDENEQFYSIIENPVKITQSEQYFSIIDRSSFRNSFNNQYTRK
ncbi:unnamed protein product (macronuclear) [Paramecium tetraurelia]|uniref:Uncharacterized protein n=1 Tax=Paramecium tetraurelia TaxID=5888 RepID=A0BCX7_PARTE|nr:uncharacterized protein GSPATT00004488001 [Paramecium tetraurelia]CAK56394.1 unnamed protein product [Paramecium tetraurelia]|eukprot:XP_001423792.1 hypothetical protein (macronuclear) [Paramecium tetraurelia strain d4-2]